MNETTRDKNTTHRSKVVLLIIDVISDFEFEDGEHLYKQTLPAARKLAEFKKKTERAKIPAIYINDNFGNWRDDFAKTLEFCRKSDRGKKIFELLEPKNTDYFVLKPKHSAFYSTTLELLLEELKAEHLIITGISTDICILFTANDAYMRGYKLSVPADCVASVESTENEHALKYIERVLKADIRPTTEIDFEKILEE